MVIGGEPLDEGGWGECTMPASTEPPMVIGGEASTLRTWSAPGRSFNGAADGDRRRATGPYVKTPQSRGRFNGAADGDRRRGVDLALRLGPVLGASTEPPMVIGGES
mgnify:CR=1 FL=1